MHKGIIVYNVLQFNVNNLVIDTDPSNFDYPSLNAVHLFWEKAQEELKSESVTDQKDACEKAFRSATEAVDIVLAHFGYYVPIGKPEAHVKRAEFLTELSKSHPKIKKIDTDFSFYKDKLHGIAFYTNSDPKQYIQVFESVGEFIKAIEELLKD